MFLSLTLDKEIKSLAWTTKLKFYPESISTSYKQINKQKKTLMKISWLSHVPVILRVFSALLQCKKLLKAQRGVLKFRISEAVLT